MKLHRFYRPEFQKENSVSGSLLTVHDSAFLHQLVKVLRTRAGEELVFFNETVPDTLMVVRNLSLKEGLFEAVREEIGVEEPAREVTLVVPPLRKERLEWLVEKSSELGVKNLLIVTTEFSQPRSYSVARLEKIAIEAAEQCGRQSILKIEERGGMQKVVSELSGQTFVCDIDQPVKKEGVVFGKKINILVGPEGGWSENERKFFNEKRLTKLSLGSLVLRAETAAITASFFVIREN